MTPQGIEASGRDGETRLDAKHESPVAATGGDAPIAMAIQPDLIERLRRYDWHVHGPDGSKRTSLPLDAATAIETLQAQLERVKEALTKIKRLKSMPIGDSGFSTGPLALLNQAKHIAKVALTGLSEEGDRE